MFVVDLIVLALVQVAEQEKQVAELMIRGHNNQDLFSLDIKRFEKFNSSLKFIQKRATETLRKFI